VWVIRSSHQSPTVGRIPSGCHPNIPAALKAKGGSIVVRRRRRTYVINEKNPRIKTKTRQR
jgi:ribosomal protein L36